MAALDFPTSPSIGQKYPASPVAGIPTYTWDGEKWTTIGGATSGGMAVLYDTVQTLTAPQQQQARQNIYAAPFDAMAYNGMQINGSMDISQEVAAAGVSVSNTTKYPVDQWALASTGSQVVSGVQNAAAPPGFVNALQVYATTANASPAAGNYAFLSTRLEGQRIYRLGFGSASASSMTVGFWIYSTKTGVFSGAVINGASTRSYVFTFTVNAANTWEYKVITIPGDTTGTWVKDNTMGMQLIFTMMTGSTYQTTAGVWTAGVFFGVAGSVNLLANTSDFWLITGVTIHPGNEAPSVARSPFIMRPYQQELVLCQRYYRKTTGEPGSEPTLYAYSGIASASIGYTIAFPVPMRVVPTITLFGTWTVNLVGQPLVAGASATSYTIYAIANAAGNCFFQPNGSGIVAFDARM